MLEQHVDRRHGEDNALDRPDHAIAVTRPAGCSVLPAPASGGGGGPTAASRPAPSTSVGTSDNAGGGVFLTPVEVLMHAPTSGNQEAAAGVVAEQAHCAPAPHPEPTETPRLSDPGDTDCGGASPLEKGPGGRLPGQQPLHSPENHHQGSTAPGRVSRKQGGARRTVSATICNGRHKGEGRRQETEAEAVAPAVAPGIRYSGQHEEERDDEEASGTAASVNVYTDPAAVARSTRRDPQAPEANGTSPSGRLVNTDGDHADGLPRARSGDSAEIDERQQRAGGAEDGVEKARTSQTGYDWEGQVPQALLRRNHAKLLRVIQEQEQRGKQVQYELVDKNFLFRISLVRSIDFLNVNDYITTVWYQLSTICCTGFPLFL